MNVFIDLFISNLSIYLSLSIHEDYDIFRRLRWRGALDRQYHLYCSTCWYVSVLASTFKISISITAYSNVLDIIILTAKTTKIFLFCLGGGGGAGVFSFFFLGLNTTTGMTFIVLFKREV